MAATCLIGTIPRDLWPIIARYLLPRSAQSTDPVKCVVNPSAQGRVEAIVTDKKGNIYYIDKQNVMMLPADQDPGSSTNLECIYEREADPKLQSVPSILFDPAGNLVLVEAFKHQIRKRTPDGLMSLYAGSTRGSNDGPSASATFSCPVSGCYDTQGNLYIADFSNHLIRKITPEGEVSTLAGTQNRNQFPYLSEVVYYDGNLYVLDDNTIKKVTLEGKVKVHIRLPRRARRCAVDYQGNFLVTDEYGVHLVSPKTNIVLAAPDGRPEGVHVDQDGNVFYGHHGIHKIEVGHNGLQEMFEQLSKD